MVQKKPDYDVLIVGAGIAGLVAALSFAAYNQTVAVFERLTLPCTLGAGIQLSSNAMSVLNRLNLFDYFEGDFSIPKTLKLYDASTLKTLTQLPLEPFCSSRYGHPWITLQRNTLHKALLQKIDKTPLIKIFSPCEPISITEKKTYVQIHVKNNSTLTTYNGKFLIGADGLNSFVRKSINSDKKPLFSGKIAWRSTVFSSSTLPEIFIPMKNQQAIHVFLDPQFHLVAYPLSPLEESMNFVFVTKSASPFEKSPYRLFDRVERASKPLKTIVDSLFFQKPQPIYTLNPRLPWVKSSGLCLIGDAAHAMLPFGAQGAAMGIEDAFTLAQTIANCRSLEDRYKKLNLWEKKRFKRVASVCRYSARNGMIWNASGLIAFARNRYLSMASPEKLLSNLDWLYGWRPFD